LGRRRNRPLGGGKDPRFGNAFHCEAWNPTKGVRVVLFVDMAWPMRFPANLVNLVITWAIAFSPFVLGSLGSYLRWERRFETVVNSRRTGH